MSSDRRQLITSDRSKLWSQRVNYHPFHKFQANKLHTREINALAQMRYLNWWNTLQASRQLGEYLRLTGKPPFLSPVIKRNSSRHADEQFYSSLSISRRGLLDTIVLYYRWNKIRKHLEWHLDGSRWFIRIQERCREWINSRFAFFLPPIFVEPGPCRPWHDDLSIWRTSVDRWPRDRLVPRFHDPRSSARHLHNVPGNL